MNWIRRGRVGRLLGGDERMQMASRCGRRRVQYFHNLFEASLKFWKINEKGQSKLSQSQNLGSTTPLLDHLPIEEGQQSAIGIWHFLPSSSILPIRWPPFPQIVQDLL